MFDDTFLGHFVKQSSVPIQDLSWLDVDEEDYRRNERLPDNKKTLNSKDQLRELWDHKVYRGPQQFSLIPNVDKKPEMSSKKANTDDIKDLLRRVRLAMAEGEVGPDLVRFIRTNFDRDTIANSAEGLKKIAREYGSLGFVYTDPILYDCENLKESALKKIFPEFALKRKKCNNCKFSSNQICLKFELPLIEKISFDDDLVKRLSAKVVSRGLEFEDDPSLAPSERLRQIFLSKKSRREKALRGFPQTQIPKVSFKIEDVDRLLEERLEESQEETDRLKSAEDIAIVNKVVGFLKTCFIQGIYGEDAARSLKAKFAPENLRLAEKPVRSLFKEQGLFGGAYITLGALGGCDKTAKTLKSVGSSARFLKKIPECYGCVHSNNERCLKTDLVFFDTDIPINDEVFDYFADRVSEKKNVSKEVLIEKLGAVSDKRARLKKLFLLDVAPAPSIGGQQASLHALGHASTDVDDRTRNRRVVDQIKTALLKGAKIKAIKEKVETLVPGSLIFSLMKTAFSEIGVVSAKAFEYCQKLGTESYKINKQASIQTKDACADCIFNNKVYCAKLGRKFSGRDFEISLTNKTDQTPEEIKEFFDGAKITIKMEGDPKPLEGEIEGLDEFTIE